MRLPTNDWSPLIFLGATFFGVAFLLGWYINQSSSVSVGGEAVSTTTSTSTETSSAEGLIYLFFVSIGRKINTITN